MTSSSSTKKKEKDRKRNSKKEKKRLAPLSFQTGKGRKNTPGCITHSRKKEGKGKRPPCNSLKEEREGPALRHGNLPAKRR